MDDFESLVKSMLGEADACTECGCELVIDRTFLKECFNCNSVLMKELVREEQ